MSGQLLVFDMDGVLVDVSDSYRETIQRTVEHFTGRRITRAEIQDWKNRGGWNDDWALSNRLIREAGVEVEYQTVVDYFNSIFHGNGSDGLILRERWIAKDGLFERLAEQFQLAVFTGRLRWEAQLTLTRCAAHLPFAPIIGADDVTEVKPAPEGLIKIRAQAAPEKIWYIGDTVDDARCARQAGVPFIGIAAPSNPRYDELIAVLNAEKAIAVLEDINQLEQVIRA
ncbi:MAG TPA: HAD-IA family hydrolase [Bryobacteraceae bacterium]|nr:HAD-IA family hydrolase [Bryobacteraceae bacterium]